jgi:hypothetical protein
LSGPWPGTEGWWGERVDEFGAGGVDGFRGGASVEAKPADQFAGPVGCAEDAGGDDLFAAGSFAGPFGEFDQLVRRALIGRGRLSPIGRSGQAGSGVSGGIGVLWSVEKLGPDA